MGCGGSTGSDPCPDEEKINWKNASEDSEFDREANHQRAYYDSKNGGLSKANDQTEKPEDFDFFGDGADAGSGDQFMAVRPYEANIKEPANHPEADSSAPDVEYELEYIYGYRCEDSR
jgi:WD40 repeat protein